MPDFIFKPAQISSLYVIRGLSYLKSLPNLQDCLILEEKIKIYVFVRDSNPDVLNKHVNH